MVIDIDLQTGVTIALTIGGAFGALWQRSFSQRFDSMKEHMDKTEKMVFSAIKKTEENVEGLKNQLQHTRENYVTTDNFENRMNDLSRQFEQRSVDLSGQLEKISDKLDSITLHHVGGNAGVPMRKVEY